MRTLITSLICALFMSGFVVAAEVTLVKYETDKKAVTVKEGDSEKTYKLTEKTKVYVVKEGKTEDSTFDAAVKILSNEKARGRLKFEITTDRDYITELKMKARKRK